MKLNPGIDGAAETKMKKKMKKKKIIKKSSKLPSDCLQAGENWVAFLIPLHEEGLEGVPMNIKKN